MKKLITLLIVVFVMASCAPVAMYKNDFLIKEMREKRKIFVEDVKLYRRPVFSSYVFRLKDLGEPVPIDKAEIDVKKAVEIYKKELIKELREEGFEVEEVENVNNNNETLIVKTIFSYFPPSFKGSLSYSAYFRGELAVIVSVYFQDKKILEFGEVSTYTSPSFTKFLWISPHPIYQMAEIIAKISGKKIKEELNP